MDPNNKIILDEMAKVKKVINKNSKRERDTYSKMFSKNAAVADFVQT